jgi:4-amino-4-deoxy-L-arabinose transferase-like glycosyltransferase
MPTVAGIFFIWQFIKKASISSLIGKAIIILFFVALTNMGQILYENNNSWRNSKKFVQTFTGAAEGGGGSGKFTRNLLCHSQANLHILSSLGNSEKCDFFKITQKPFKDKPFLILVSIGVIFSFLGYGLLLYLWKKEKDSNRKNFLALVFLYGIVSLIAIFPIITQASLRYYIVIFFLPFILLGVWLKFFGQILKGRLRIFLLSLIILALAFLQLQKIKETYEAHQKGNTSDTRYAIYGEVKEMMEFISQNVDLSEDVYIAGKSEYFSRFYKPFLYFGPEYGVKIKRGDKTKRIEDGAQVIYLQKNTSDEIIRKKTFMNRSVKNHKTFENVSIINYGSR